jgi:hypothetical protein
MDNNTYHRCAFCDKVIGLNDDVWTDADNHLFCSELHAKKQNQIEYAGVLKKVLKSDENK